MNSKGLLLICLWCILSGSIYGQKKKQKTTISDRIDQFVIESTSSDKLRNGDLVIALIDSFTSKEISRINRLKKNELTGDIIFELGDLTQIFTSLLVHELVNDDRLDLKQSINALLPIEFQSPYFQDVTLQDCLSHTTGLPRLPNNIGTKQVDHNQPFEHYKSSDLASFIKGWSPSDKDRGYRYSLIGFELIGIILEHQFKKPFGQLIQDELNPRYGFESLSTAVSALSRKGKNKVGNEVEPMRFASFVASSGLKANCKDLVQLLVNPSNLSRKAFLQSLKIHAPTKLDSSVSIASAWHHYEVSRRHSFYLHKGSTKGFSSFLGYQPATNTGVIILSSKKINLGPMGYYILGQLNDGWKR